MSDRWDLITPEDDACRLALAEVLAESFGCIREDILGVFGRAETEDLRALTRGGEVVGGLVQVPMGQWFGGHSVPCTGIAVVGTASTLRGSGGGAVLMERAVSALHEEGVALSSLYPASVRFYRKSGYELAGSFWKATLAPGDVDVRGAAPMRRAGPDDFDAMVAAYDRSAREHPGMLDRGRYLWERVRTPKGTTARHVVFEEQGRITGCLSYTHLPSDPPPAYDLRLSDAVALTPAAVDACLGFLAGHATLTPRVTASLSPHHPLLVRGGSWGRTQVALYHPWMLRLTHVDAALAARGYPPDLNLELHLRVTDDVIPAQSGDRVLKVADGRGTVEPGGRGELDLDVRGLAALYTGHLSPDDVARLGLLTGGPEARSACARIFAGPSPWMADMF